MKGCCVPIMLRNCEFSYWKLPTHSNCFMKVTLMLPKGQESGSYHISAHGLKFSWLKKTPNNKQKPNQNRYNPKHNLPKTQQQKNNPDNNKPHPQQKQV